MAQALSPKGKDCMVAECSVLSLSFTYKQLMMHRIQRNWLNHNSWSEPPKTLGFKES